MIATLFMILQRCKKYPHYIALSTIIARLNGIHFHRIEKESITLLMIILFPSRSLCRRYYIWCSILGIPVQFVVDSREVKSFWNIYKSTIWYPIFNSTKTLSKWRFKFSLIPVIDRVPVNTKISLCTYSEYRMNNIFLGNFISGRTLKFKLAKIVSTNLVVNNKNLPPLLLVMMAGME